MWYNQSQTPHSARKPRPKSQDKFSAASKFSARKVSKVESKPSEQSLKLESVTSPSQRTGLRSEARPPKLDT